MTLNIGLNNNPASFEVIKELFEMMYNAKVKYGLGKYGDTPEPTAIVEMEGKTYDWVENLCQDFDQECIAVKLDELGFLIYNPDYTGKKQSFDNQYFIDYEDSLPDSPM